MTLSKCLSNIHGVGALLAEGCVYTGISYFIEFWREQNGMIRTVGIIDARSEIIRQLGQTENLVLTLETGERTPIIITDTCTGHAEIRIFGPVAGLAHHRHVSRIDLSDQL